MTGLPPQVKRGGAWTAKRRSTPAKIGAVVAAAAIVIAAVVWVTTRGGSGQSGSATPSRGTAAGHSPELVPGPRGENWLLSGVALHMLAPAVATQLADSPHTFLVVGNKLNEVPTGSKAILVATFTRYADLNRAVTQHRLSPLIKAVLYDNEAWSLTPPVEQRNPAEYEQRAAEVAHSHGLLLISTPATSLTGVLDPGPGKVFAKYLSLGIAGDAAKYADVVDLQAQGSQPATQLYTDFVAAATAQARAANPRVIVLAGLSTNPHGPAITYPELAAVVNATHQTVDGYWLNIPIPGTSCPLCNAPQPGLADQLLRQFPVG